MQETFGSVAEVLKFYQHVLTSPCAVSVADATEVVLNQLPVQKPLQILLSSSASCDSVANLPLLGQMLDKFCQDTAL